LKGAVATCVNSDHGYSGHTCDISFEDMPDLGFGLELEVFTFDSARLRVKTILTV